MPRNQLRSDQPADEVAAVTGILHFLGNQVIQISAHLLTGLERYGWVSSQVELGLGSLLEELPVLIGHAEEIGDHRRR
ncbi:hypothetical protein D9M71_480810 [compost metagenome]